MYRQQKATLLQDKADELRVAGVEGELSGTILKRWFSSQRTMYVKERDRGKSGDGQTQRTERQANRLAAWSFLGKHIVPKKRRQQLGVRIMFIMIYVGFYVMELI